MTTTVPSWKNGVRELEALVPDNLRADLERLADELRLPFESLLVAARAKVVAALAGEPEVAPGSWRELIAASRQGDPLVLETGMQADHRDAEAAARIAGYHLRALTLMAADVDAPHAESSLLSDAELRFQINGLAGPRRELPDRRFHELFEQRAAAQPDAVAAMCGDHRWTYAELNGHANRLARALFARGIAREEVVAVVTERNLHWMAAVLAVFKAGAAYLPVEPHFPADRIAAMLTRAECRVVLTEAGSTGLLDQALAAAPAVDVVTIDAALAEGHAEVDLGIAVDAGQLAYIYFTSGSTGEPKGAMCEHAGLLNHLFAKIDDLGIRAGQVVAQTAPQCFDISLWQLFAATLAGGHTLLIEQDVILDAERFIDEIVDGRVAVLQVVPSYLDVILTHLEQRPRELPDLRCVSVTGEAVSKELTQRWFAAQPQVLLANAYGLTETSDDTNHEVMDRAPTGDRVPLGPAINNVHIYVVDDQLQPVPLGAPGEIVFSGVCVGRGYINDPDRTAAAFMADPHRPGERLYRSGDRGRWLADGKLEFLGRRDSQVKISGFRIEIGEVEAALSRVPGVGLAAAVVAGKRLAAFYSAPEALDAADLREQLSKSLPAYMVPAVFHWYDALPLNANAKVDRKALTARASALGAPDQALEVPSTKAEQRLALAWAEVLGIPYDEIGRTDHFFDRGGNSLAAVKLVMALDRAVTLQAVTRTPILADLAQLVDTHA